MGSPEPCCSQWLGKIMYVGGRIWPTRNWPLASPPLLSPGPRASSSAAVCWRRARGRGASQHSNLSRSWLSFHRRSFYPEFLGHLCRYGSIFKKKKKKGKKVFKHFCYIWLNLLLLETYQVFQKQGKVGKRQQRMIAVSMSLFFVDRSKLFKLGSSTHFQKIFFISSLIQLAVVASV